MDAALRKSSAKTQPKAAWQISCGTAANVKHSKGRTRPTYVHTLADANYPSYPPIIQQFESCCSRLQAISQHATMTVCWCLLTFQAVVTQYAHHRDHEEDEGQAREPEIPEGTVLQLARPLCSGLEGDHAAEQLGCDCSPASLQS